MTKPQKTPFDLRPDVVHRTVDIWLRLADQIHLTPGELASALEMLAMELYSRLARATDAEVPDKAELRVVVALFGAMLVEVSSLPVEQWDDHFKKYAAEMNTIFAQAAAHPGRPM